MASEQSFEDRVQRADELHLAVAAMAPAYIPADSKFTLVSFTGAIGTARATNLNVITQRLPYDDAVTDRQALAKAISPLVTQSLAYVKSNTAWAKRYEAVKKAADKVRGVRPNNGKKGTDPEPDKKTRETGERSFVDIAAFFKAYIDRLTALSGYAPPDEKITLTRLTADWQQLDGLNKGMTALSQSLADAIRDRQDAITGETGLKFTFTGVKTSAKGQYGQRSPQYQSISGLSW